MKKFLCVMLSALMLFGTAAFAACGKEEPAAEGQTNGSNEQNQEGNRQEEENGGEQSEEKGEVPPADDKAEEDLSDAAPFLNEIATASFDRLKISGTFSRTITRDTGARVTTESTNSEFSGAVTGTDADLFADNVYSFGYGEEVETEESFAVCFMREGVLYSDSGMWLSAGVERGDFGALVASYKADEGRMLVFDGEASDFFQTTRAAAASVVPFSAKLAKNLSSLLKGELTKEGEGYRLSFDLVGIVRTFADHLNAIVKQLTPETTLSEIVALEPLNGSLQALLEGISAEELSEQLPAELSAALPPTDGKTAYRYLVDEILGSKTFYAGSGLSGLFDADCFGEISLGELLGLLQTEDPEALLLAVSQAAETFGGALPETLYSYLVGLTPDSMETDCGFSFLFDGKKQLTGLEISGKAEILATAYEGATDDTVKTLSDWSISFDLPERSALTDISGAHYEGAYASAPAAGSATVEGQIVLANGEAFDCTVDFLFRPDRTFTVTVSCPAMGLVKNETRNIFLPDASSSVGGTLFEAPVSVQYSSGSETVACEADLKINYRFSQSGGFVASPVGLTAGTEAALEFAPFARSAAKTVGTIA